MSETNQAILNRANARVAEGDIEGFLEHCTEDTTWHFVGDRTLEGKAAVRAYMQATYVHPPKFNIAHAIEDGDDLAVYGEITLTDAAGKSTRSSYCDVWRLRDGKLAELRAFVIEAK
jgi:ketosteroid isomerase-like protein